MTAVHEELKVWHLFDDVEYTQCGRFLPDLANEMGREEIALWDGQTPPGDDHICHQCIRDYNHGTTLSEPEIMELCQPQKMS